MRPRFPLTGSLALLLASLPAHAQYANGDGHALDRSLQQGAGGRNVPIPGRDIRELTRINNALVTGNAAFGKSFRSDVGYRAPDEFRAALGSNDLFAFRRDATASALATQGVSASDIVGAQSSRALGTTASTGAGGVTVGRSGSGANGGMVSGPGAGDPALRRNAVYGQTVLGYRRGADGGLEPVIASPLTGLQIRGLNSSSSTQTPPNPGSSGAPDTSPGSISPPARSAGGQTQPGRTGPGHPQPGADAANGRENPQGNGVSPAPTPAQSRADRPRPPTLVNTLAGSERAGPRPTSEDQFISGFRDAYIGTARAVTPRGAEGPNGNAPDATPTDARARPADAPRPGGPAKPGDPTTSGDPAAGPAKAPWEQRLDELKALLKTKAPVTPEPVEPDKADTVRPKRAGQAGQADEAADKARIEERRRQRREAALRALDPATLQALRESPKSPVRLQVDPSGSLLYADSMAKGQAALAKGDYFDAESGFGGAMAALPGDRMATVGRINAQIGAGLYVSAASALRTLLTEHPEVVSATFDADVLPQAGRTARIFGQLRDRLQGGAEFGTAPDPQMARNAGLLLAYLGHQRGDAAAVKDGLAALEAHSDPDDSTAMTFNTILRTVWGQKDEPGK